MGVDNQQPRPGEISNKDYVDGVNYALQRTRWFLTILGIWPYITSNPTKMDKYVWRFLLPVPILCVSFLLTGVICFYFMRDLGGLEVIGCFGRIIYQTCNILKNVVLIARRDAIKYCIEHMESDWRNIENHDDRDIMMKNLRIGRGISFICFTIMYSSAVFFDTMPLYSGKYVNELNQTVRQLVFPGPDLFLDLQAGYNYEMVFSCQCLCAFFMHFIITTSCDLAAILVSHACGQIQIVMFRLENLVGEEGSNKDAVVIENQMAYIIKTHARTLRFATRIDELLREICLLEMFSSTLIICWFEYFCLLELENGNFLAMATHILFLSSVVFNTYIFCHIGEILKEQCQKIGNAAYMIEWFRLPGKTALSLLMIIAISNIPRKLTAGRIMELSHYSFGNIMRTSLGYLNMLRQMSAN